MRSLRYLAPLGLVLATRTLVAQVSTLATAQNNQFQFQPATQVGSVFGTGSTPFQVSQITARIINQNASASSAVTGSIYVADAGNLPVGSPVGTLSLSASVGSFSTADAVFTPDAPLILGAHQSYLFVLSTVFGNWAWWETLGGNAFSTPGSDPWTMPVGIAIRQGAVPSWSHSDLTTDPTYDYRNQLSIQGASVPEPGWTAMTVGAGLLAWSVVRRRR
jgi:hypothetical protein